MTSDFDGVGGSYDRDAKGRGDENALVEPLPPFFVVHVDEGILFYHRNPGTNTLTEMLIKQQGLERFKDEIADDLCNRTFGGMVIGAGFRAAGTSDGTYQTAPYRGWKLVSKDSANRHDLRIVTHIAQTETLETWRQDLRTLVKASAADGEAARKAALAWWSEFWDRSWIVINPDKPDAQDKAWRAARNYIPFGDPRADATRGYNDLVEKGVMANGAVAYHWESQLEHAYMMLEYHRFTDADITTYVPFIENAVVFFDEHYRRREMLMQTVDDKIRLFPAWPKEWDVDFKLHAPHRTTVTGRFRNGKVVELAVSPKSRKADVVVMAPSEN